MDSEFLKSAINQLDLKLLNDFLKKCNINGLVIDNLGSKSTPLLYALNREIFNKIDRLKMNEIILRLISAGADVNATGNWSVTPLIFALKRHRSDEIVCQLINAGSNVNGGYSEVDDSPLMIAVQNEYSKRVLDSIIGAGADVNYCTFSKKTALKYALSVGAKTEVYMTLIHAGVNVHARDYRDRNYFFEVPCNCLDGSDCKYQYIINVLLDQGVDITENDKNGNNILHWVKCSYLISVAVRNGVAINSVNKDGFTPLMRSINCCHVKKVNKLLLLNANPNCMKIKWEKVYELFRNAPVFDEIINLLIYHDADVYSRDHRTSLHEFLIPRILHHKRGLLTIIKHLLLFFDEDVLNDFLYGYLNEVNMAKVNCKEMVDLMAKNCKVELNKMHCTFLKDSLTFYQFCILKKNYKSKYFDIPYGKYEYNCTDIKNLFPVYEDLIVMRIKDYKVERFKKVIRKCLESIIVISVPMSETDLGEQLNYDCLYCIAFYLDDKEVCNLFLASIHD